MRFLKFAVVLMAAFGLVACHEGSDVTGPRVKIAGLITPAPTAAPTPTPTPIPFGVSLGTVDPPQGTRLDLGYPSSDASIDLWITGTYYPANTEAELPAAIGFVYVCNDGSNGRAFWTGLGTAYLYDPLPIFVYQKLPVRNVQVTDHYNPLDCPRGNEINAMFFIGKRWTTPYDLLSHEVGSDANSFKWDLVAYKKLFRLGYVIRY